MYDGQASLDGELLGVETLLHTLDDSFFGVWTWEHIGIAHTRHYWMSKRLTAAIAGRFNVVILRTDFVMHVTAQDSVFDQIGFLTIGHLVINVDGAPAVRVGLKKLSYFIKPNAKSYPLAALKFSFTWSQLITLKNAPM